MGERGRHSLGRGGGGGGGLRPPGRPLRPPMNAHDQLKQCPQHHTKNFSSSVSSRYFTFSIDVDSNLSLFVIRASLAKADWIHCFVARVVVQL